MARKRLSYPKNGPTTYDRVSPDARSSAPQKRLGGVSNDARQAGLAQSRRIDFGQSRPVSGPTIGPKPDGMSHVLPTQNLNVNKLTNEGLKGTLLKNPHYGKGR